MLHSLRSPIAVQASARQSTGMAFSLSVSVVSYVAVTAGASGN